MRRAHTFPPRYEIRSAMFMGVLVIAFPVSVFSELRSEELRRSGALVSLVDDGEDDENEHCKCDTDYQGIDLTSPYYNTHVPNRKVPRKKRTVLSVQGAGADVNELVCFLLFEELLPVHTYQPIHDFRHNGTDRGWSNRTSAQSMFADGHTAMTLISMHDCIRLVLVSCATNSCLATHDQLVSLRHDDFIKARAPQRYNSVLPAMFVFPQVSHESNDWPSTIWNMAVASFF
jgi:hypothetical protein